MPVKQTIETPQQVEGVVLTKKRGRKPKNQTTSESSLIDFQPKQNNQQQTQQEPEKQPKKRGRKPKGGKIVTNVVSPMPQNIISFIPENTSNQEKKTNIILHLQCSTNDLKQSTTFYEDFVYNPNIEPVVNAFNNDDEQIGQQYYSIDTTKNDTTQTQSSFIEKHQHFLYEIQQPNPNITTSLDYKPNIDTHNEPEKQDGNTCQTHSCKDENETQLTSSGIKTLYTKLRDLQSRLHHNNTMDKKSHCFWCTCSFDTPPIYIPKNEIDGVIEVYGCFSTPECACAYLFNEKIDTSTKWERYSLLNRLYGGIFEYTKNIKPAPSPYYILDKYYGNMSEKQYHDLLQMDTLMLVVDKPLSRVLPEIHEENHDYPNISLNKPSSVQQTTTKKYKLARNKPAISQSTSHYKW